MSRASKAYREQAELSRELAGRIKDKETIAHLLNVAQQYDNLADQTEKKEKGGS